VAAVVVMEAPTPARQAQEQSPVQKLAGEVPVELEPMGKALQR
jgi:hypothetical protein